MLALRVLVVDDEEMVRRILTRYLVAAGHQVDSAVDGTDALRQLSERSYDVALVDVLLPGGVDGLTLLGQVRVSSPELKVIIVTGHGSPEMERTAREQGAVGFLTKPFSLAELGNMLAQFLP